MSCIAFPLPASPAPAPAGGSAGAKPSRQGEKPAAVEERQSKKEQRRDGNARFVVFPTLLVADTEADVPPPARPEPAPPPQPAAAPPVATPPHRTNARNPLRLLASSTPATTDAAPREPAETRVDQPSPLGLFELQATEPANRREDKRVDAPAELRPEPTRRAGLPSAFPTKDSALTQRLRTLLAARGEEDARGSAATAPPGNRRTRTVRGLPPTTADRDAVGTGQERAAESGPATGTAPTATRPAAHPIALDLVTALQGRLPATGAASSFQGISLALESATHGTVDLDIRYGEGVLAVTIHLQRQLPAEEAESCRQAITAACEEQGYQGVEVDVRHGNSHHHRHERRGYADDQEEVRLAGKEFPQGEDLAALGGPATPALPASRFAGGRAVGPTGTGLAKMGEATGTHTHRPGIRHGNH